MFDIFGDLMAFEMCRDIAEIQAAADRLEEIKDEYYEGLYEYEYDEDDDEI